MNTSHHSPQGESTVDPKRKQKCSWLWVERQVPLDRGWGQDLRGTRWLRILGRVLFWGRGKTLIISAWRPGVLANQVRGAMLGVANSSVIKGHPMGSQE